MPDMQTPYSPSFPGMIRIMGGCALLLIAGMIGHECGRFSRTPSELAYAAILRVKNTVYQPEIYFKDAP